MKAKTNLAISVLLLSRLAVSPLAGCAAMRQEAESTAHACCPARTLPVKARSGAECCVVSTLPAATAPEAMDGTPPWLTLPTATTPAGPTGQFTYILQSARRFSQPP